MMREIDLAYLAGLIDGEGCIGVVRQQQRTGPKYTPGVSISNTSKVIIDAIAEIMSASQIPHYVRVSSHADERSRTAYAVGCFGFNRAFRCLWIVEPFIRAKKPQAQLVLSFIWNRYNALPNGKNRPYTGLEIELTDALFDLNHRGPNILNEHTLRTADVAAKMCSELRGNPGEVTEMITRLSVSPSGGRWVHK